MIEGQIMNDAYHLIPLIGISAALALIVSAPASAQIITHPLAPVTTITQSVTAALPKPIQTIVPATTPDVTISTDEPSVTIDSEPATISTRTPVTVKPHLPSSPVVERSQVAKSSTSSAPASQTQPSSAPVTIRTVDRKGLPLTLALQELSVDYAATPTITNSRQVSASGIVFQLAVAGLLAGAGALYYAVINRQT